MDRSSPYPSSWTVREARDAYLAENGFTEEAYDAKWTHGLFFGIPVVVPNTKKHRWAIMLHDLHHVALGFGTDLAGEAEISAWEVRHGLPSLGLYVGSIVFFGMLMGGVVAPKRTLDAFRAAKRARSLFALDLDYEKLLAMSVGELRELLGVPNEGLAKTPRELHGRAPAAA
jgi:hypothetical protein